MRAESERLKAETEIRGQFLAAGPDRPRFSVPFVTSCQIDRFSDPTSDFPFSVFSVSAFFRRFQP
jgi:hypothetical protein